LSIDLSEAPMRTSSTPTAPAADAGHRGVDPDALRAEVRVKYAEVATNPDGAFHFHTGRPLAAKLGYPTSILTALPDSAMASFAGVDNPFNAGQIPVGARVVDLGSGGGFDCFVAADLVGPTGQVVGVDMTPEMLDRSRREASRLGLRNVEFRAGILEQLPVDDDWADVVISNGVLNLVADKMLVLREALRVLRPGGVIQFADIAVGKTVPEAARCDIELWTDCVAGGLSVAEWTDALTAAGFDSVAVGFPTDSFAGAAGETRARDYEVFGHTFRAEKPVTTPQRTLDAPGLACVDLTPLIAKTMRELEPGEVLAVRTDDPAARVGVPAWCRLTGNRLVQTRPDHTDTDQPTTQTTFHIAKKES
jgi:arsenite methyltransferase